MNKNECIALKEEIGELITEINASRSAVPKKKLKYLRKSLRKISVNLRRAHIGIMEHEGI